MKQEQFLYKSEGLYYMQNVPEYPVANRSGRMFSMFGYEYELAEYYEALERAKEEAHIQCPKDGELYRRVLIAHGMFQEYNMYTLNMEENIEVVESVCGCSGPSRPGCAESEPCKKIIARIAAPKKEEESELTQDELNALSSVGIIAKNWYAVSYSKNQMPFAIFESIEYAKLYRDKFSSTSIVEPWPMVIKDLRKK